METNKALACLTLLLGLTAMSGDGMAACTEANSITQVKNTSPAGQYRYVVFSVKSSSLPSYTVNTVVKPLPADEGADPNLAAMAGAKFKKIQFKNMFWMCASQEAFALPTASIKDIKRAGRFEGVIAYIVGTTAASPAKYMTTYHYQSGATWKVVMKFRK